MHLGVFDRGRCLGNHLADGQRRGQALDLRSGDRDGFFGGFFLRRFFRHFFFRRFHCFSYLDLSAFTHTCRFLGGDRQIFFERLLEWRRCRLAPSDSDRRLKPLDLLLQLRRTRLQAVEMLGQKSLIFPKPFHLFREMAGAHKGSPRHKRRKDNDQSDRKQDKNQNAFHALNSDRELEKIV